MGSTSTKNQDKVGSVVLVPVLGKNRTEQGGEDYSIAADDDMCDDDAEHGGNVSVKVEISPQLPIFEEEQEENDDDELDDDKEKEDKTPQTCLGQKNLMTL